MQHQWDTRLNSWTDKSAPNPWSSFNTFCSIYRATQTQLCRRCLSMEKRLGGLGKGCGDVGVTPGHGPLYIMASDLICGPTATGHWDGRMHVKRFGFRWPCLRSGVEQTDNLCGKWRDQRAYLCITATPRSTLIKYQLWKVIFYLQILSKHIMQQHYRSIFGSLTSLKGAMKTASPWSINQRTVSHLETKFSYGGEIRLGADHGYANLDDRQ